MDYHHTEKMRQFYTHEVNSRHGGDYEHSRWHANPLQQSRYNMTLDAIMHALAPITFSKCFELGPGPGTWTRCVYEKNSNIELTLLDISTYMKEQFEKANAGKNFSFIISDFESYQMPQNNFDLIFSIRAIDYIDDRVAAIAKLCSGLKSGGNGIIVGKTAHLFKQKLLGQKNEWQHDHIMGYAAMKKALQKGGCVGIKMYPVTVYIPVLGRINAVNTILQSIVKHVPMGWWNEWMTESFIAVFKKS